LQKLEHVQVVSFEVEIFGVVKVYRIFSYGTQCFIRGQIGAHNGFPFAGPFQAITFFVAFNYVVAQLLPEQVKVDGFAFGGFSDTVGKKCSQLVKYFLLPGREMKGLIFLCSSRIAMKLLNDGLWNFVGQPKQILTKIGRYPTGFKTKNPLNTVFKGSIHLEI
jgi:hypothetical protein